MKAVGVSASLAFEVTALPQTSFPWLVLPNQTLLRRVRLSLEATSCGGVYRASFLQLRLNSVSVVPPVSPNTIKSKLTPSALSDLTRHSLDLPLLCASPLPKGDIIFCDQAVPDRDACNLAQSDNRQF